MAVRWLDRTKQGRLKLAGTLGLAFAALVTGLGWQITAHVPVQSVSLSPSLPGINEPLAYFGQTDQYVYVGVVERDKSTGGYYYTYQINALPRSRYLLTFNRRSFIYCRPNQPPADLVERLLSSPSATPTRVQC
jgi:hypothetical protein